jgi:predicted MFS family arabinose efflux permease
MMGCAYFFGTLTYGYLLRSFSVDVLMSKASVSILLIGILFIIVSLLGYFNIAVLLVPIFFILFTIGFIMPASSSLVLSLFPDKVGLCSSLMGFLVSFFTGLTSVLASLLPSDSLIPTAFSYAFCTFIICSNYFLILKNRVEHE